MRSAITQKCFYGFILNSGLYLAPTRGEPNMLCRFAYIVCTFLVTTAASAAINGRPGYGQADSSSINQSANTTDLESLTLNGSNSKLQSKKPQCVTAMGTPPLSSCMEALSHIRRNRQQLTFGQRRLVGIVDHVLPYDFISCMSITSSARSNGVTDS